MYLKCKGRNYFHSLQYKYIHPSKLLSILTLHTFILSYSNWKMFNNNFFVYLWGHSAALRGMQGISLFRLNVLLPYITLNYGSRHQNWYKIRYGQKPYLIECSHIVGGIGIIMLYLNVLPYTNNGRFIENMPIWPLIWPLWP